MIFVLKINAVPRRSPSKQNDFSSLEQYQLYVMKKQLKHALCIISFILAQRIWNGSNFIEKYKSKANPWNFISIWISLSMNLGA